MHRSKITLTAIVALLVVSSFAFIASTDETDAAGGQWDGFNKDLGVRTFGSSWEPISSVEDLQNIKMNGKYYLTKDIDLTNYAGDMDSFQVKINISRSGDSLTVTINRTTTGSPILKVTDAKIFVNGEEKAIASGDASATFTTSSTVTDLRISAVGTADIPSLDKKFAISVAGTESQIESQKIESKGNFKPLGSKSSPFTGTIDGNGYSIIGLRTTVYNADSDAYSGLIAYSNNATIKNLGLKGGSSFAISSSGNAQAGGLVGFANGKTTISNSFNKGTITAISGSNLSNAGGLFGHVVLATNVADLYNAGAITAMSISNWSRAGGLFGNTEEVTVANSYNTGNIAATSSKVEADAGGLVGIATKTIIVTNCYNTGTITTTLVNSGKYAMAGGLIGYSGSNSGVKITESYNKGKITSTAPVSGSIVSSGGLLGCSHNLRVVVEGSYNVGDMSAYSKQRASSGGLLGYMTQITGADITGSYNTGTVRAESKDANAGGLVGYGLFDLKITGSYNAGAVTAKTSGSDGIADSGGIIGWGREIDLTNTYNTGTISASTDSLSKAYVGGLAGTLGEITVNNSYNVGITSGDDKFVLKGGLLGNVVGISSEAVTMSNSYAIKEKGATTLLGMYGADQTINDSTSDMKAADEMKASSTFSAWELGETWYIDATKKTNQGYPYLHWVKIFYLDVQAGEGGSTSGSGYYDLGAKATVTAVANDGYKFKEWSNGIKAATTDIEIKGKTSIQAIFEELSSDEPGGGDSPGGDDGPGGGEEPGESDEPGGGDSPGGDDGPGGGEEPGESDETGGGGGGSGMLYIAIAIVIVVIAVGAVVVFWWLPKKKNV